MSEAGMASFAVIGLVVFVTVFAGIALWALTRGRKEIDTWSSLPLADGTEPVEPRLTIVQAESEDRRGCGKCDECTCDGSKAHEPALAGH